MIENLGEIQVKIEDEEHNVLNNPLRVGGHNHWYLFKDKDKVYGSNCLYAISPSESRIKYHEIMYLPPECTRNLVMFLYLAEYNRNPEDCLFRFKGDRKWLKTFKLSDYIENKDQLYQTLDIRKLYEKYNF